MQRIVGIAKAKELLFTTRRIDAKTAMEIGLVNRVVEPAEMMPAALELAREIAKNGPIGVAQAKFAINYGMEASLGGGAPAGVEGLRGDDSDEGPPGRIRRETEARIQGRIRRYSF